MKLLTQSLLNFLFPPLCLSCNDSVKDDQQLLCVLCQSHLHILEKEERCRICFGSIGSERSICKGCSSKPSIFYGTAAAFDYAGPAAALIRSMKYSDQPYLAKGLAAYMTAQFLNLEWPIPDVIIPVPISKTHVFQRGYNQSLLLANEMSKLLQVPVENCLARRSGDYSQAGLSKKQRTYLKGKRFYLLPCNLQDKSILLIDDVITTGTTMNHCGQTLLGAYPRCLYALAVCKAEQ